MSNHRLMSLLASTPDADAVVKKNKPLSSPSVLPAGGTLQGTGGARAPSQGGGQPPPVSLEAVSLAQGGTQPPRFPTSTTSVNTGSGDGGRPPSVLRTDTGANICFDGLTVGKSGPQSIVCVCGLYPLSTRQGGSVGYFEVFIVRAALPSQISIGLGSSDFPLNRKPGWEPKSFAYNSSDGHVVSNGGRSKSYGPAFSSNDIIGCGIDFAKQEIFFTKNGKHLGAALQNVSLSSLRLFPVVSLQNPHDIVTFNFSHDFKFQLAAEPTERGRSSRPRCSPSPGRSPSNQRDTSRGRQTSASPARRPASGAKTRPKTSHARASQTPPREQPTSRTRRRPSTTPERSKPTTTTVAPSQPNPTASSDPSHNPPHVAPSSASPDRPLVLSASPDRAVAVGSPSGGAPPPSPGARSRSSPNTGRPGRPPSQPRTNKASAGRAIAVELKLKASMRELKLLRDKNSILYTGDGTSLGTITCNRSLSFRPPTSSVGYFEILIVSCTPVSTFSVGLTPKKHLISSAPGTTTNSCALVCVGASAAQPSHVLLNGTRSEPLPPNCVFQAGDVVGCGLVFSRHHPFFTKNGQLLHLCSNSLEGLQFPTISLSRPGDLVCANFGKKSFVFSLAASLSLLMPAEEVVSAPNPAKENSEELAAQLAVSSLSDGDVTPSKILAREEEEAASEDNDPATPAAWLAIRWQKGEVIGRGAFGTVFRAVDLDSGQPIAVKLIQLLGSVEQVTQKLEALEHEIRILQSLNHANIVRYLGAQREKQDFLIFLEYVPGGSISSVLAKTGPLAEDIVRGYTKQILHGLLYLHTNRIIHRDIKGANILVGNDGVVKLADFGASKQLGDLATATMECKSTVGSPYWMAPEVIQEVGHGRKADIWGVGCTVLEMVTGKHPWSEYDNHLQALFQIASGDKMPHMPPSLSEDGQDFIRRCLQRDPKTRPSALQLLEHPFVTT